jgi:hypothetical protein
VPLYWYFLHTDCQKAGVHTRVQNLQQYLGGVNPNLGAGMKIVDKEARENLKLLTRLTKKPEKT